MSDGMFAVTSQAGVVDDQPDSFTLQIFFGLGK
jgi:hypothetical protein